MPDLLRIEPQILSFPYEPNVQVSCTIRLFNVTGNHVAFKVKLKATNPAMYSVQPNDGIVKPWSTCDITVRARPWMSPNMRCRDKFLIQSTVVTTRNITREMFNNRTGLVQEIKLGVVYVYRFRSRYSKVSDWFDRNKNTVRYVLIKAIIIGLVGLLFWLVMKKMLSLIWSWTVILMMLVVRKIKSEVSDRVEGWIIKCLATVCIHFFYVIFSR